MGSRSVTFISVLRYGLYFQPWHHSGGCVGGGEGTILRSGSYIYMLIEAPDITLGCLTTPGQQNWPLGLLRSPTFAFTTGQWEQFSVEPTVVPIIKEGCYIQVSCVCNQRCNSLILMLWVAVSP